MDASLWAASAVKALDMPPLDGDRRADVAIIGGGFTGCSAALHLAQKGVDAVVLEASEVGWGASGRNIGHVLPGLWINPDVIAKRAGPEHGSRLVEALGHAPETVYAVIERYCIDCDLVRKGVIRAADTHRGLRAIEAHVDQWRRRGASPELIDRQRTTELLGTERYLGGYIEHRSATIQPLSYVRGLARAALKEGATIHENTRITSVTREQGQWRVDADRGCVRADALIVATNTYSDDLMPNVRASIIPGGCFAYATEPMSENVRRTVLPAGHPVYDTQPVMAFARKDRDDRLILGSLGYLPRGDASRIHAWPNRVLRGIFPQLGEPNWAFKWAGSLGFTTNDIPRLHEPAPDMYVALGYNGRGIAQGTLWGKFLAERVTGMPAADLPLPVTPLKPVRFRQLWIMFYDAAFRAYRFRSLVD